MKFPRFQDSSPATNAKVSLMAAPLIATMLLSVPAMTFAQNQQIDRNNMNVVAMQNSNSGNRLLDGQTGSSDSESWLNDQVWNQNFYPMSVDLSLGGQYDLSQLRYFVGNLTPSAQINFLYSNQSTPSGFVPLITVNTGHQWNSFRTVSLSDPSARFLRIVFNTPEQQFNISELQVFGQPSGSSSSSSSSGSGSSGSSSGSGSSGSSSGSGSSGSSSGGVGPGSFSLGTELPPDSISKAMNFGKWTPVFANECPGSVHDRYWAIAPDNRVYHTWHPSTDFVTGCQFGHEHGDDPRDSEIFDYAQGFPPFGYAMQQQMNLSDFEGRREDHVGHKVTVANNIRLAIGNSANVNITIWDTGITCDLLSKIHMGSHSVDAMTNSVHEYFLNLSCDDTKWAEPTAFSVKQLAQFGRPNEFVSWSDSPPLNTNMKGTVSSQIKKFDGSADNLTDPQVFPATSLAGDREHDGISAMYEHRYYNKRQPEIWAMTRREGSPNPPQNKRHSGAINIDVPGGGSVEFFPYYIVKNPSRLYDGPEKTVRRTIEFCYPGTSSNRPVLNKAFCTGLPPTYPGEDYWKSPASPFNGGFRGVNFKGFGLANEGGPREFCTDAFGENAVPATGDPTNPCPVNTVFQKAAPISNYWAVQGHGGVGADKCILDVDGVCRNEALVGTIERFVRNSATGQWQRTTATPKPGGGYTPAGIGFEWISNHADDAGVHAPN